VKFDRFDPSAREEYLASLRWYRERDADVAARFREEVLATIASICESPARSPLDRGMAKRLGVRRRVLAGFPYAIFYVELETEIFVLAVAHCRRRPSYWRRRLRNT
jgi:plasmid stabilization system protein ParE